MTTSAIGFKWVDILEKEFDKSFVGLEEFFKSLAEDLEVDSEALDMLRKFLANIGSCYAQAMHKAQTIFQVNAKQEAELVHLREELATSKANMDKLDAEKQYLVCRLQSTLLENHKLKTDPNGKDVANADKVCEGIQLKLAKEMAVIKRVDCEARRIEEKCLLLQEENKKLRRNQVELESELVGARLDSKYLDKELAGRIQQIQILLANGTTQEHKQKVWSQIETEMHLQRSKTISNMCFSKQKVRNAAAQQSAEARKGKSASVSAAQGNCGKSRLKQVHIHKSDSEEMGMAILGGREHGLPIMISEIFPNTAVGRCDKICAGDVILAVNGDSFDHMGHHEAVKYLSSLRGTIKFDLENRIDDEIDDLCDMDARYYDLFRAAEQENSDSGSMRGSLSHPGRARLQRPPEHSDQAQNAQSSSEQSDKIIPEVHSSPRKEKGEEVQNGVVS